MHKGMRIDVATHEKPLCSHEQEIEAGLST
jgi:hypothetical protein